MKERLKRYTGLTGRAAEDFLRSNPLTVTKEEADSLDRVVRSDVTERIINAFNRGSKLDFRDLPSAMQTVIASVGYQHGPSFETTPRFFRAATAGNITAMLKELRGSGDPYPSRRNLEADYLERNLPRPKLKPRLLP
jgi:hypothetical protein